MIIAMCCTRNWYIYLQTELYALFKHNKVKKVYLFIEDDEIEYLKDDRIEFINVNKLPEYIKETSPNYNTKYSKLSYLRCYFSKILKEDKILYLDADTLVVDNIEDLWKIDLGYNVLVGIHEPGEWNKHLYTYGLDDTYINSGVLVMDLKKIRDERLDDAMIYLLNNNRYEYPDQDVINLICRNRIHYVDKIYNSSETIGMVDNAKIIHYIRGRKGWIKTSPRSEIWYNYHKEAIGGNDMDNYVVRAIISFNDYEGKDINKSEEYIKRKIGDIFKCSSERYLYLKEHNAVELVEIEKTKKEEVVKETANFTEDKPLKEENKKSKKKKSSKK